MISINSRDPRPIYEQIKAGFIRMIVSGGLKTDEQLPSVRELASTLAVNPNTIQRAYRELEAEGYLYTVPGKGAYVSGEEQARERYRAALWRQFDACVLELAELGESPETLAARISIVFEKEEEQND